MSRRSASTDDRLRRTAATLARRCRRVVQACLREEEWLDADEEFCRIIREGFEEFGKSAVLADGDANPDELTPEPP